MKILRAAVGNAFVLLVLFLLILPHVGPYFLWALEAVLSALN